MSMTDPVSRSTSELPRPPESWPRIQGAAQRVLAPVERFLAIEAASGILLLAAAVAALIWANSSYRDSYNQLFELTHLSVKLGPYGFDENLRFLVNEGLMTIFFFVAGLELRRELHQGELSEVRRAMLPLMTAVGGMLAPAAIFAALNHGHPTNTGWGVPMATDIAFAVGALALLGSRVPPALRVLLLALAVIDDVGAILVIAFFYSSGLKLAGFSVLALGVALVVLFQKAGVRSPWAYVPPGVVIWIGIHDSGVHPALAGVLLGMLTPARAWFGAQRFLDHVEDSARRLRGEPSLREPELMPHLDAFELARREAVSPVERLQHSLHGWVAYGIMPIFALANAGVPIGDVEFTAERIRPFLGVLLGLTLGKPIGILAMAWITTRMGLTAFPKGVGWRGLSLIGVVAGIGFTMSLFVAGLAFPKGENLEISKLGILSASSVAALATFLLGSRILPNQRLAPGVARTAKEAEESTAA